MVGSSRCYRCDYPEGVLVSEIRIAKAETKVAKTVAEILRGRILEGELAPGQRLIESDIQDELEVSRGAIREAFIQLDAEGLVELRHQRGAAVTKLNRKDMADLFAVRERLEGFSAFLAAENVGEGGNRVWLTAQRENWMRAEMLHNELAHMEENVPFHDGLIQMSGNGKLIEVLHRMQIPAYRQRLLKLLDSDRRQESVEDHLMVIDAILAGDGAKAEEMMRLHVRRSGELALSIEGLG
jgi:DNA-binding GntR family transcriptional regulator